MKRKIMENSNRKKYTDVMAEAEAELVTALKNYSNVFIRYCSENNGIPSMNQIEDIWKILDDETRNVFIKMISGSISSVDESIQISLKKANTD